MPIFRACLAVAMLAATVAAAQKPDTVTTKSGLRYVMVTHGKGALPKPGQLVRVHYTGRLTNGSVFDDSRPRGTPYEFHIGRGEVIKGWDVGVALLHVGDRATLIIPPALGYGAAGAGPEIPPNSVLLFDVELVGAKEYTLAQFIENTIDTKGIAAAEKMVKELKPGFEKTYHVDEDEINSLGYGYLGKQKVNEAIAVLRMNVARFPKSSNAYDSLGEAYMVAGKKELAIANYRRSFQLDGTNNNAMDMLAKIVGTP